MTSRIRVVVLGGSALATPVLFESLAKAAPQQAYDVVLFGRDTERLGLVERVSQDLLKSHERWTSAGRL